MSDNRKYVIEPLNTPSVKNCWLLKEITDNKVTAAWGFRSREEAEAFDVKKVRP